MSCRTGLFLFVGASLALGGCGDGPTAPDPAAPGAPRPVGPYFDVRGLLDAQVQQLTARHPGVTKHVALRGGAPETVQVPQVKWADELQIFYQADINKAALRGAYAVDSASLPGGAVRVAVGQEAATGLFYAEVSNPLRASLGDLTRLTAAHYQAEVLSGGAGLGLWLSNRIAELHGAPLALREADGQLYVRLRLAKK